MDTPREPYDWDLSTRIGEEAVDLVLKFIISPVAKEYWADIRHIHPVENNDHYRVKDIDLVLIEKKDSGLAETTVEIKGDRNKKAQNFFFETVSDKEKNTPGAFYATQADWILYYFISIKTLYCIPTLDAKQWFGVNIGLCMEREVQSSRKGRSWTTVGRLVAISQILKDVPTIQRYVLIGSQWERST
jgi:hypothetical protein